MADPWRLRWKRLLWATNPQKLIFFNSYVYVYVDPIVALFNSKN